MRPKLLPILLLMILLPNTACNPQANLTPTNARIPTTLNDTLTVLAAASLTAPFNELGMLFEAQNPGVKVEFSYAGSQQLAQQLIQGAPADVFASASQKYMDMVVQANRVTQGSDKNFTRNRLVVIYPVANPARIKTLQDLAKPGLKLDLEAREVPAGQYSLDFLDKASKDPAFDPNFKDNVLKNVVSYEENVKSVLTKVALGEADAGIVYLSDVSGNAAGQVGILDIPDALNVTARYPIATISDSHNPDLAKAFMDLVLSPDGQKVLAKNNFIP